jgi:hypothetical protein
VFPVAERQFSHAKLAERLKGFYLIEVKKGGA